jgi:hypothetical protein
MRYSPLALAAIASALAACDPDAPTGPARPEASPAPSPVTTAATGWRTRAPYPTTFYEAKSAAITDAATGRTTLYVVGGRANPRNWRNVFQTVRALDVSGNTWQTRAPFPLRVTGADGAVEIKGKIYVPGGVTSVFDTAREVWRGKVLKTLYIYTPATNSWTRRRDMPFFSAYGVTGTHNDLLYAAIYCDQDPACANGVLLRYNPSTDRWMNLGPTPHSPAFGAGGFVSGKLYLVDLDGNVDIYNVATANWSAGPKAPYQQQNITFCPAASAILKAKLYLVGCHDSFDFSTFHPMQVLDPGLGTWKLGPVPPIPAYWHWWSLTRVVLDGKPALELVGGADPDNHAQFRP